MAEPIIERIRRLLALSESSNVHEAATAAAKAAELMAKHRIDAAEIEAADGTCDDAVEDEELDAYGGKAVPWRGILGSSLAKANGCRTYLRITTRLPARRRQAVARIIGTAQAVATVRYMLAYLTREVDRLCGLQVELQRARWRAVGGRFDARTFVGSFRLGAAFEIARRIEAAADAANTAARASASGTALARVDRTTMRVDAAFAAIGVRGGPSKVSASNSAAFIAGRRAGSSVVLSTGPALGAGTRGELTGTGFTNG